MSIISLVAKEPYFYNLIYSNSHGKKHKILYNRSYTLLRLEGKKKCQHGCLKKKTVMDCKQGLRKEVIKGHKLMKRGITE